MISEFELIARYFRPLASAPGALGLRDDAALLVAPVGQELVISTDTSVASVHFLPDMAPDIIARRALRVALSDIAAMGAEALGYFLSLSVPKKTDESWFQAFAQGLKIDNEQFGVSLMGGDTTRTPGPLTITVTVYGAAPKEHLRYRSHAKEHDLLYVTGTLGDAALGLKLLKNKKIERNERYLPAIQKYYLPEPRLRYGIQISTEASALMDISDGLLGDLCHMLAASGNLGAEIWLDRIPLSEAMRFYSPQHSDWQSLVLSGGDDYELLVTIPASRHAAVATAFPWLYCIGEVVASPGITVKSAKNGDIMDIPIQGFDHFSC